MATETEQALLATDTTPLTIPDDPMSWLSPEEESAVQDALRRDLISHKIDFLGNKFSKGSGANRMYGSFTTLPSIDPGIASRLGLPPQATAGEQTYDMLTHGFGALSKNPLVRLGEWAFRGRFGDSPKDAALERHGVEQAKRLRSELGRDPTVAELMSAVRTFDPYSVEGVTLEGERQRSAAQDRDQTSMLVGPDIDSPEVAAQFDVNDRSLVSNEPLSEILRNNTGILGNDPSIENQNTLMLNSLLVPGMSVTEQDAYARAREDINPNPIGFVQSQADIQGAVDYLNQLKDATLRERAFEAARGNPLLGISSGMGGESGEGGTIIYEQQDVMPWGAGDEYMEAQGFVSNMPRPEAVNVDRPIYYTDSGPMPTEEQIDQSILSTMEMVSKARDPKDAGQSSVVKALQQEQKKATQKVADLEKQQKDHRAKIDKGGESAEAAGKFEAKRLYNEHQAALASEKALKSQNTMATLLQAMNIQRSEELARRERDRLERERRARLYGDAFDPSGRR